MVYLSNAKNTDVLTEFQDFLLDKKLAPENHVFFHALWVSKFLFFANKNQIPPDKYMDQVISPRFSSFL